MNELSQEDKALIKTVIISYHGQYIKPADRLVAINEDMPAGCVAYKPPLSWKESYK